MKRSATRIVAGGGAACFRLGAELLAEDEEQSTELGALGLGQAGEEFVFGVALCLGGAFELLLPARVMVTTCPAAIVCGAFAGEAGAAIQAALKP